MGIHLAAKGLKIEGFLGCHGNSEYTAINAESIELRLGRLGKRPNVQAARETGSAVNPRRFPRWKHRQNDLNPAARRQKTENGVNPSDSLHPPVNDYL
jgi:hypothetical protein